MFYRKSQKTKKVEKGLSYTQKDDISINAHQIRTAMSAVKWIVEMFLEEELGKLTPEQEKLLSKAKQSTDRAIGVANELLLVNKTEDQVERKYKFNREDFIDIIEDSIFNFSGEAHNKGVEVIFLKPDKDFPNINADREKILVVLYNLLDNSIKYSDSHGKVFISISKEGKDAQFSIKNRGLAIKEEEKGQIFQKFYRSPEARKREPVGSGIGLYTIKKIIEEHGGKIWFNSSVDKDTTFYFTIPIYKIPSFALAKTK